MKETEMLSAISIHRIDGFHTSIESEDEVVKYQSETHAIGCSQLFIELIETELATWLVRIFAQGPYITGINKQCAVNFPEQMGSVLCIKIQFHVAALINVINAFMATGI